MLAKVRARVVLKPAARVPLALQRRPVFGGLGTRSASARSWDLPPASRPPSRLLHFLLQRRPFPGSLVFQFPAHLRTSPALPRFFPKVTPSVIHVMRRTVPKRSPGKAPEGVSQRPRAPQGCWGQSSSPAWAGRVTQPRSRAPPGVPACRDWGSNAPTKPPLSAGSQQLPVNASTFFCTSPDLRLVALRRGPTLSGAAVWARSNWGARRMHPKDHHLRYLRNGGKRSRARFLGLCCGTRRELTLTRDVAKGQAPGAAHPGHWARRSGRGPRTPSLPVPPQDFLPKRRWRGPTPGRRHSSATCHPAPPPRP